MSDAWRVPMVVGSVARLGYGAGCALAPSWMAENELAPSLREHADPRMSLRGFGGAQSAVALYTIACVRSRERARDALALNALVDGFDTIVSLLERRDRGRFDQMAAGGVAVNVLGLGIAALGASLLRRA